MTPLRILLAAHAEADAGVLTHLLARLCHSVQATATPTELVKVATRSRVDLIVLCQGGDDTAHLLGRLAGLRAVSDLPVLLVCDRADPVLVDGLADWPACSLVYQPVDSRGLYAGIGLAVAEWERMRALERELLGLRGMVSHMRGALMHTDDAGRVTDITADALRMFGLTRDGALGQTLGALLGIPEAPPVLALRAAEPLVELDGRPVRVIIRACEEGGASGAGWIARIEALAAEADGAAAATAVTAAAERTPERATTAAGAALEVPELRNLNLSVVAREVASEITRAVSGRSFRAHVEANMRADADERLLRELLERLFDVARGATYGLPNGQVRLGQRVTRDRVVYYVFDNGRGDDPARQEFLRDRTSPKGYGRIERIVALHGGVAGFKLDEVGRGATVFFTLPGTQTAAQATSAPSPPQASAAPTRVTGPAATAVATP
jgi:AmiR/NasT family two-component response regulator